MNSRERTSGIELLKILAMLLIVISHVAQTFGREHPEIGLPGHYFIDVNQATGNLQYFIIGIFRYLGALGNNLFFMCSVWFLCDSKKTKTKKVLQILVDVWVVSVVLLGVFLLAGTPLSKAEMVKCLMPTTFQQNWYIVCYLIIYMIHPGLNAVIEKLSQKHLLAVTLGGLILYSGVNSLGRGLYFYTEFMVYIVLYFVIAYAKRYMKRLVVDRKQNIILLLLGILLFLLTVGVTNLLGLRYEAAQDKLMHWNTYQFPPVIIISFALLNLFREWNWKNKFVNRWASCALLVYVIHENCLVRIYFRPYVFVYIKEYLGYSYIVFWVLAFSVALFFVATIGSLVYQGTLGKITKKIVAFMTPKVEQTGNGLLEKIMKIN